MKMIPLDASESVQFRTQQELITLQKAALACNTLGLVDHFQNEEFTFIVTKKPRQTLLEHLM